MNPLNGGTIPKHKDDLAFLAKEGENAIDAALRFNIGSPQITVSLIGFGSFSDIDHACKIVDDNEIYSDNDIEDIKSKLGEHMNLTCSGCGYCKVCPMEINTPAYMLLYNEKQMFKKTDEQMIQEVYGLECWNYTMNSKGQAQDCIKCGKCENECTQHLPIISRLEEIAKWEEAGVNNVNV